MKMPLLHEMDAAEISGVVEATAVAMCQFNFTMHDGLPGIIENEPCESPCDFCLTQALYTIYHIVDYQKEKANEQQSAEGDHREDRAP